MVAALSSPSSAERRGGLVVPVFLLRAVIAALREEGLSSALLLDAESLRLIEESDGLERAPFARYAQLLRAASITTRDPRIGLRIGQRLSEANLHLLGPIIVGSQTLRGAFRAMAELQGPLCGGQLWELHERGVRSLYGPTAELDGDPALRVNVDLALTLILRVGQRFLTLAQSETLSLQVRHAHESERADYERAVGVPVRVGADRSALCFPTELLDIARPGTDAASVSLLQKMARDRFTTPGSAGTWSERVQRVLEELPELDEVSFERLATRWQISLRTLRRRVEREGSSTAAILRRVRFERARGELSSHQAPITEIARKLGYADAGSFHRAFKRWAGVGPSEYRARHTRKPRT
jgi:AraC-like DNA-binding protein